MPKKKLSPKVIESKPTGSCYRMCRRAINSLIRCETGIAKSSTYIYKAVRVPNKPNTAIVTRCYRDWYKTPTYPGKWQSIGLMPINPNEEYG